MAPNDIAEIFNSKNFDLEDDNEQFLKLIHNSSKTPNDEQFLSFSPSKTNNLINGKSLNIEQKQIMKQIDLLGEDIFLNLGTNLANDTEQIVYYGQEEEEFTVQQNEKISEENINNAKSCEIQQ
eukprot:TRINITY_DN4597_c0_g1_i3.p5 TRINITY_DN4597_c0_g1~~TRINITY_DN4597_c0_g1_i3.p5  ORF type:complete len:124 (-),score=28.71 TRINITY_DN4597_c0_g1_i3:203-574(-)